MKEAKNIINIRIRKRDVVLNRWWRVVKAKEEGLLSIFIREAILHYIRTQSFKDIGHIYVSKEDEVLSQPHCINVWIGGCEEIKNWISERNENCSLSQLLREILRRSITLVSSPSEEWIPGYLEMEDGLPLESIPVRGKDEIPVVDKEEPIKQEEPKNDTIVEKVPEKQELVQEENINREKKIRRRAMALGGSRTKV